MTTLAFDLIQFEPLRGVRDFRRRYGGGVRVSMDWGRLLRGKCRVGLVMADASTPLFLPWYDGRDGWKGGVPRRARPGKALAVARVPAVRVGKRYLVLDGCHRLTQVRPAVVLVDYVAVTPEQARGFTDMHNDAWRPWARRTGGNG